MLLLGSRPALPRPAIASGYRRVLGAKPRYACGLGTVSTSAASPTRGTRRGGFNRLLATTSWCVVESAGGRRPPSCTTKTVQPTAYTHEPGGRHRFAEMGVAMPMAVGSRIMIIRVTAAAWSPTRHAPSRRQRTASTAWWAVSRTVPHPSTPPVVGWAPGPNCCTPGRSISRRSSNARKHLATRQATKVTGEATATRPSLAPWCARGPAAVPAPAPTRSARRSGLGSRRASISEAGVALQQARAAQGSAYRRLAGQEARPRLHQGSQRRHGCGRHRLAQVRHARGLHRGCRSPRAAHRQAQAGDAGHGAQDGFQGGRCGGCPRHWRPRMRRGREVLNQRGREVLSQRVS